jgi:hypothetical protein
VPQEWQVLVESTDNPLPSLNEVIGHTLAPGRVQAVVALLTPDDVVVLHKELHEPDVVVVVVAVVVVVPSARASAVGSPGWEARKMRTRARSRSAKIQPTRLMSSIIVRRRSRKSPNPTARTTSVASSCASGPMRAPSRRSQIDASGQRAGLRRSIHSKCIGERT